MNFGNFLPKLSFLNIRIIRLIHLQSFNENLMKSLDETHMLEQEETFKKLT